MNEEQAVEMLASLRFGKLESVEVTKADFSTFRKVLAKQEDMTDFRGNARHYGAVLYTYEPGWTK
ncbi:hypothetical protein [Shouchella shacheensis]|uniref:hypothetical protein n=1 Tax=Shouchella shacheensis TaxID=1649580 RepID=UPI00073FF685|nr:hypothetical protein [Shouchella shacheensis]